MHTWLLKYKPNVRRIAHDINYLSKQIIFEVSNNKQFSK